MLMQSHLRVALRIIQVIFALFLVYFALRLFHYHLDLATFPFPISLREGAMMTSTEALVKNLNPFGMSLQPRFMNQYGIILSLISMALGKDFWHYHHCA